MPHIVVTGQDGTTRNLDAPAALSVMETLRNAGYPVAGACEGSVSCATCHVIVDPAWADRLPAAKEDEEEKLDSIFGLTPTSRLSCQITMTDALDGLAVRLPTEN